MLFIKKWFCIYFISWIRKKKKYKICEHLDFFISSRIDVNDMLVIKLSSKTIGNNYWNNFIKMK